MGQGIRLPGWLLIKQQIGPNNLQLFRIIQLGQFFSSPIKCQMCSEQYYIELV